jgi:cytochrome d ubiquinol oxidase subunit II
VSSLATPYFLGAVVGGVASGRVPAGIAAGDVLTSWVNPTSMLGGVLAVLVCAYLAAVFLCADARREGADDLVGGFRVRALGTAAVTGAVGIAGLFVLRSDAPQLFDGLTGRALPVVVLSVVAGVAALGLLWTRRFVPARAASALAVTTILAGWAVAQYPYVLVPDVTIEEAAGGRATLTAVLVALVLGSVVLLPALAYLYWLFQQAPGRSGDARRP